MTTILLCFFLGGFTLGSAFGCMLTLSVSMDRANKARKLSPELMATMQEAYRD